MHSVWNNGDPVALMLKPVLLQPIFECDCPNKVCKCGAPEVGSEIEPEDLSAFARTMWIDGGSTTGWAIVWFDPDVLFDPKAKPSRAMVAWWAGMVLGPELNHTDYIMAKLRMDGVGGPGMCVGGESFRVHSVKQDDSFLSSPRVIAATEWALHRGQRESDGVWRHRRMPKQAPIDAIGSVSDDRLKLLQMYLKGADHPRDATRHCILWLRRLKDEGEAAYDQWHFTAADNDEEQSSG